MKTLKFQIIQLIVALLSVNGLMAKGVGTSGGLTLIETSAARSAALGEAFTPVTNDVAAFHYNPASLGSLDNGHASFMYQKGLVDDAFGQFSMGTPIKQGSLGLSIGYYNGGDIELFDGTTERTVNAQTDLTVGIGYAHNFGKTSIGVTGKYLSSELIETEKAQAFAGDLGIGVPLHSRVHFGAALQNFGSQLKFVEEGDDLPRIARAGLSLNLFPGRYSTMLLLDAPYYLNEQEARPAVGLEVNLGLISLRAGYKSGSDLEEFSVGTGFMLGRSSLDYSYGLVEELDSQHRVSLSMRFGQSQSRIPAPFVKKDKKSKPEWTVVKEDEGRRKVHEAKPARRSLGNMKLVNKKSDKKRSRQVYTIRPGDSLSKIARKHYGNSRMWKKIWQANRHLLDRPQDIVVGQRIVLP